jgi:serine/threonine protein kinase
MEKKRHTIDDYDCIRKLGEGSWGEVKLAIGADGRNVAIKVVDKSKPGKSENALKSLRTEV